MKYSKIYKCSMDARFVKAKGVGKVLHVAMQGDVLCFWYIYNPVATERVFTIVGTGQDFDGTYIGTTQDGPFVWHLVEI